MEHGGFQKMDFSIKTADKKNSLDMIDTDCIVIGIYDDHKLTDAAIALDTNGVITRALESGDISGKAGSALLVGFPEKIAAKRLLLPSNRSMSATCSWHCRLTWYPVATCPGRFTTSLLNCTPSFTAAMH